MMIGRSEPGTRGDFGAIVVYGCGLVALGVLGWSLAVVADRLPDRPAAPSTSVDGVELHAPAAPPSAVLAPLVSGIRDAVVLGDWWFLLDRYNAEVHRVNSRGVHVGSFAGEGDGPGELRYPQAITAHYDTVVVATPHSVHLYTPDGTSITRRRIEPPQDCPGAVVLDVASSPSGLLLLFGCGIRARFDAIVGLEVGESVYRPLATGVVENPFMWTAVLAPHPGGFVFGHPEEACLEVYDMDGQVADSVCHERIERHPVGEESQGELDALGRLATEAGMDWNRPRFYPPFEKVFVRDDGGLVYRALTPGQNDFGLLVGSDGERVLAFDIPHSRMVFFGGKSVLAAWHDPAGTLLAVYDLEGS